MNTPGSTKIDTLAFSGLFDISLVPPKITLTNLSTGPDLPGCTWWFVITSPSGTPIHTGSLASPDITGAWTTWVMPEAWPQVFQHIEWSGAPYTVQLYVNDGTTTYGPEEKNVEICPPRGNTGSFVHNFGYGAVVTAIKCSVAKVFVQDKSNYLYKSSVGSVISQDWRLVYPPGDDGTSHVDETISGTPYAYFPLTYNGAGFNVFMDTVIDYDLGQGITVRIKYKVRYQFAVRCANELTSVLCGYQKLISKVADMTCVEPSTQSDLLIVSSRINFVQTVISAGREDIDISAQLAEIDKILKKYDCCCPSVDSGIFLSSSSDTNVPGLSAVTGVEARTPHTMIVDSDGAGPYTKMMRTGFEAHSAGAEIYAALGLLTGITQGGLALHAVGAGTVYQTVANTSNTYIVVWPSQPASGPAETLAVDSITGGFIYLKWVSTPANPNLLAVTTIGNITDKDMISGSMVAENALINSLKIGLRNGLSGTKDVIYFFNAAGVGRIVSGDPSSAFTTTIQHPSGLSASLVHFVPKYRSGEYALVGNGVSPAATPGVGAGSGAVATFGAQSDDTKGLISIVVGSGATGTSIVVSIVYNTPYIGLAPIPQLTPVQGPAQELYGTSQVCVVTLGLAGFSIQSGTTPLAPGNYAWFYTVKR